MDTGKLIKKLRLQHNLTQEELGAKLGVQKSAIAKYESGRVENLKRSTIQRLSELFGVSPIIFLGFDNELSEKNTSDSSDNVSIEITTIEDAMMFFLSSPVVSAYGGYDFDNMSDDEKIKFANKMAGVLKMIADDYKE